MYNKTIWNSGDIITQEKWDNINNNLSILGAYQLPATIEERETPTPPPKKVSNLKFYFSNFNITIHKSYNEITKLLKQGVICWYYNNLDGTINYITQFNDQEKTLRDKRTLFYFNGTEMTNIISEPIDNTPVIT